MEEEITEIIISGLKTDEVCIEMTYKDGHYGYCNLPTTDKVRLEKVPEGVKIFIGQEESYYKYLL